MSWCWRDGPVAPGPAVVFDLDGVLSDAAGRQRFLAPGRKDWDAFFAACGEDELFEDVARLLSLLDPALRVVLLTGRPVSVQPQTLDWLARHELRWDLLIMRDEGDYSAALRFKRASLADLRAHGLELCLAFEDDRRNLEMLRSEGVPCVYIHSGYYE